MIAGLLLAFTIHIQPGADLAEARNRIQLASEAQRAKGIEVVFAAGRYTTASGTLELAADDSGADGQHPVLWRAEEPGKVIFSQATQIPLKAFTRADATSRVIVTDLADKSLDLGHPLWNEKTFPLPLPEVYQDGRRLRPAEWPNGEWTTLAAILAQGTNKGSGNCFDALDGKEGIPSADKPSGGVVAVTNSPAARWVNAPEVLLHGYWCFDWYDSVIPVAKIDSTTTNDVITFKFPHWYGVRMGNPNPRRWKAIHLREELDAPGEFFVDRVARKLYIIPYEGFTSESVISFIDCGKKDLLSLTSVSNVVFRGIRFEGVYQNAAALRDCSRVAFDNCTFGNIREKGIAMSGDCRKCVVRSCEMIHMGCGGVAVSGGDRQRLIPASNRVENCLFRFCSEQKLVYTPAVHVVGVGNIVRHNEITDIPHIAVALGAANDTIIEYNIISNVCTSSDDAGAFYKGRNPSSRGTQIRYNLWQDIGSPKGHGTSAIYFDDGDSGDTVFGNIFIRCGEPGEGSFGTVFSHGGYTNLVANCIFIDCKRALGSSPWKQDRWIQCLNSGIWKKNIRETVDIGSPIYLAHYPELARFLDPDADDDRWNTAHLNAFINCGEVSKGRWRVDSTNMETKRTLKEIPTSIPTLKDFQPIPLEKMGRIRAE